MKTWNKKEFGNIFEEKIKLETRLNTTQFKAIQTGYKEELRLQEKDTQAQLNIRYQQEENILKKKYRIKRLTEGEKKH